MRRAAPSPPCHSSGAAGAASDRETVQPHRIAQFQHLRVGHPRVGHVRLHRGDAVEPGSGAGAAADRFVILPVRVAEQEVVHRRLRAGDRAERTEQRIAGGLRHFRIARHHRRTGPRRKKAAGRNDQLDRFQAAVVQRDIVADQAAEHVQHRGTRDRRRGVEIVVVALRAGAGEIDARAAPRMIDRDRDPQRRAVIHRVSNRPPPMRSMTRRTLSSALSITWRIYARHGVPAVLRDDAPEFLHAFFVRRDLRLDVGHVHVRAARRPLCAGQQRAQFRLAEMAAIDQQEIVDDNAFFFQCARCGRRRARRDAADIGVVPAAAEEEQDALAGRVEHRRDHRHVRQMRPAVVRDCSAPPRRPASACPAGGSAPCARFPPSRPDARGYAAHWQPDSPRRRTPRRRSPAVP